jgi:hypothetical protein
MKAPMFTLPIIFMNIIILANSQTACDYEVEIISSDMGYFNTKGYNPLNASNIYDRLNQLRASILGTYQLCFNRSIIDPDALFPQDIGECFHGLYNVSQLASTYTGNYAKIKTDIDAIAKIVFSTQNDCRPVLYYKGWNNFTNDCQSMIPTLDDLFNKYG